MCVRLSGFCEYNFTSPFAVFRHVFARFWSHVSEPLIVQLRSHFILKLHLPRAQFHFTSFVTLSLIEYVPWTTRALRSICSLIDLGWQVIWCDTELSESHMRIITLHIRYTLTDRICYMNHTCLEKHSFAHWSRVAGNPMWHELYWESHARHSLIHSLHAHWSSMLHEPHVLGWSTVEKRLYAHWSRVAGSMMCRVLF